MRKILTFLSLLLSALTFAQEGDVTGTVTDAQGEILPGVNVLIEGTTTGTQTDFDGVYNLRAAVGQVIKFTYVGFVPQSVVYAGQPTLDISLKTDENDLDEVVVVGYGSSSRAKVSSAISSVKGGELTENPVIGLDQALQGRASGVTVQSSGSPGQAPTVRVRGLSTFGGGDPLYVVDGLVIDDINNINPSSIESVDILKDAASAAIYGSRGSNGVVLITTKKGKKGWSKLGLSTYTGYQRFDNRYDLLNAQEYAQYAEAFGNVPPRLLGTIYAEEVSKNDTDWQDEIFVTAPTTNIDMNYSGGGDNINYYMYGGYIKQEGVIINTGFDRYTFGVNSDIVLSEKFKIGESFGLGVSEQAQLNESGGRTIIEHAIKSAPILGVFEPGTTNFQGPANRIDDNDSENPVRVQSTQERINRNTNFYGSLYGEYEFIEGLKFRQQVGVNLNYNNNDYTSRSYDDGDYSNELIPTQSAHRQENNFLTKSSARALTTTLTSSVTYDVTLGDSHDFTATAVYELLDVFEEETNVRSDFQQGVENLGNVRTSANSLTRKDLLVSYIGRLNYSYANKYLLSGSIRRDGSSRFGKNYLWGSFPAASAAWRVSEENFLADNDVINELKLRASYGVTGNNDIALYSFQSKVIPFGGYIIGDGATPIVNNVFTGFANDDLKWERSIKTNYGFDLGLFNNKVTLAAEYFTSRGTDLLISAVPSPSDGIPNTTANEDLSGVISNVGEVNTKGFEFQIGYNDNQGDFTWSIDANLSTSKNEVLSTGNSDLIPISRFEQELLNIIRVGDPILSFFGWQTDGIFQSQAEVEAGPVQDGQTSPGDIRFRDINGDGVINDGDRTIIGNPFPKFNYGLNFNAAYKGFDFVANLYGVQGVDAFNSNLYDVEGSGRIFNAGRIVLDSWTPENTNTTQPRVSLGDPNRNVRVSDRYIEDASFLRVKNLTLGYSFSQNALNSFGQGVLSKFRIYIQGQNLFTITDYSGYDPEIPARRRDFIRNQGPITELGVDRGFYPTPRTILAGVQVEF